MSDDLINQLLSELGIGDDYGTNPFRPRYLEPTELVDVELNVIGRMQRLTPPTAQAWREMKSAAESDGVGLMLVSGFRSVEYQATLLRKKLSDGQPLAAILEVSAAPGYSQHHTGQTVDIATPGSRPLTEEFETTDAFVWLRKKAAEFGFNMPYPQGNKFGFAYEPWHWTTLRD